MLTLIERHFAALAFVMGAGTSVIVLNFPWFSFLATIMVWTAMRAPKDFGVGHHINVPSARTISDAAHEGLWAAVAIVFGVTILFESVTALVWA